MTVTGIRPIKRGLALLYIDGEAALRLDREVLLLAGVKEGTQFSDEELQALIARSDARRAYEKALYLLEHRSHSKKELVEKILAVAPREAALVAVARVEELGLVDDEAFATVYARELFVRKRLGIRRVRQELYQKGIEKELIEEVLEALQETAEDTPGEKVSALLEKKYPRWAEDEKVKRRAVAALQRLGYSWDDIKNGMEQEAGDTDV